MFGAPGYLRQHPASDEVPDVAVAGGRGQHTLQCVKMDLERLQVVDHVLRRRNGALSVIFDNTAQQQFGWDRVGTI
jgi:hypothetical protein